MAKHYTEVELNDWNSGHFRDYLVDKHLEMFDCSYQPFGGWGAENGRIGRVFGTKTKSGEYPKEVVKTFIDVAMDEYKPTRQYPGTSFGFLYTYRKPLLQKIEQDYNRRLKDSKREEQQDDYSINDLTEWFKS